MVIEVGEGNCKRFGECVARTDTSSGFLSIDRALYHSGGGHMVDACVVDERVLIYREDELENLMGWTEPEFDPCTDVQVSPDDPCLTEMIAEDNSQADAYAPTQTLSIH
jgi:hypothetical protein